VSSLVSCLRYTVAMQRTTLSTLHGSLLYDGEPDPGASRRSRASKARTGGAQPAGNEPAAVLSVGSGGLLSAVRLGELRVFTTYSGKWQALTPLPLPLLQLPYA